jgi:hypothetical protein
LSADGRRLAFVSEATTLSHRKRDTTKGVLVRDLDDGRLALASAKRAPHRHP